jgi:two-component sensor histidine kinase/PAS domain-containing protein
MRLGGTNRLTPGLVLGTAGLLCQPLAVALLRGWGVGGGTSGLPGLLGWYSGCALVLVGVGLWATAADSRISVPCGSLVVAVGAALFYQLATDSDLGLRGLFAEGRLMPAAVHSEPASFSVVVCIVLLGTALLASGHQSGPPLLAVGAIGAAVASAGLTSILSGLAWLRSGTSAPPVMPPMAALGFALAGIGLSHFAWFTRRQRTDGGTPWVVTLAGVAAVAASLGIWQAALTLEHRVPESALGRGAAGTETYGTPLSDLLLVAGLLAAALFTWLSYLTQALRVRLRRAEAAKIELAGEAEQAKRAQSLLRAAEQRFRDSFESIPAGFGIFTAVRDASGGISDFQVEYLNKAGAAALGAGSDETMGRRLSAVLPGYTNSPLFHEHRSVVETGKAVAKELTPPDRAGSPLAPRTLYARFTKLSDGFAAVWLDATEQKRAREAQRDVEARYSAFFHGVPVGLYRASPSGEIFEANPALVQLLRFPDLDTLRAFNASAFYIDPAARARQRDLLSASGLVRGFEMKVMCYDNSVIWLRDTCRAVSDDEGQLLYYEGMMEDITDQKRAEEQIRASLAEKELLLKEVHHRVKNNLQVISSLLSLQSASVTDRRALDVFMECQHRVRSMAMVHERLYQAPDLASIDFPEYVQSLVASLCRAYGSASRSVAVKVEVRKVSMGVDEAISCGLIINELVSNSLKHAFPEGRQGAIWVTLDRKNGSYVLTVGDDGAGLPASFSFSTAATLGLQMVRTLAEQLEGTIELDTKRGTEFRITFPPPGGAR